MTEKRSPTAHRTPAQIRAHGRTYQASEEQKKNRAARNKARAQAMADGRVSKGDGKDIDHKVPLSKGGGNAKSNTRVVSKSANRGHGMTRGSKPNKGR
jgi:5-methylcytosine-specific restriction endonuclease McrA